MVKSIEESKKISSVQLERLIDVAGSQAHLSRMLSAAGNYSITPQGVLRWVKRGQISKRGAYVAMQLPAFSQQFTLSQLRPDVTEAEWGFISRVGLQGPEADDEE